MSKHAMQVRWLLWIDIVSIHFSQDVIDCSVLNTIHINVIIKIALL